MGKTSGSSFFGKFSRSFQQNQGFLLPLIADTLPLGLSERQPLASDLTALAADIQADFIAHCLAHAIGADLPAVLAIEYAGLNPGLGAAQDGAGVGLRERERQDFSFAQGVIRHRSLPFHICRFPGPSHLKSPAGALPSCPARIRLVDMRI